MILFTSARGDSSLHLQESAIMFSIQIKNVDSEGEEPLYIATITNDDGSFWNSHQTPLLLRLIFSTQ